MEQLAAQEQGKQDAPDGRGKPDELAVLVGELAEELQPATAAWVVEALALLGAAGEAAERLRCRAAALREAGSGLEQADAAAAAGDWRRAGLLYRQLLRPDGMERPMEPRPFRRPDSW